MNRFNGVQIGFFSKLMFERLLRAAGFVNVKFGSLDYASILDVFNAAGHFSYIGQFASNQLPSRLRLRFLQDVWPDVFASHLCAVGEKPG